MVAVGNKKTRWQKNAVAKRARGKRVAKRASKKKLQKRNRWARPDPPRYTTPEKRKRRDGGAGGQRPKANLNEEANHQASIFRSLALRAT